MTAVGQDAARGAQPDEWRHLGAGKQSAERGSSQLEARKQELSASLQQVADGSARAVNLRAELARIEQDLKQQATAESRQAEARGGLVRSACGHASPGTAVVHSGQQPAS